MSDLRIRRPEDPFGCVFEIREGQHESTRARGEKLAENVIQKIIRERGIAFNQDRLSITETVDGGVTRVTYRYTPQEARDAA